MRPLLQHISLMTRNRRAFVSGPYDEEVSWFGIDSDTQETRGRESRALAATGSGYVDSRFPSSSIFMPAGKRTHRPAHADSLHIDLFVDGENILLDPGTFAYTASPPWDNGLASTRVHNTCSVEDRDQMRRVGRFMWSRWNDARITRLERTERAHLIIAHTHADDRKHVLHKRLVLHRERSIIVFDRLVAQRKLTMRAHWNLLGDDWERDADQWTREGVAIRVEGDPDVRIECRTGSRDDTLGWYSPTYGKRIPCTSIRAFLASARFGLRLRTPR